MDKSLTCRAAAFTVILLLCLTMILWEGFVDVLQSRLFRCYSHEGNLLPELDEAQVPIGEAFFFHETSCERGKQGTYQDIKLNARQACAVESAALHHPHHCTCNIYLVVQ